MRRFMIVLAAVLGVWALFAIVNKPDTGDRTTGMPVEEGMAGTERRADSKTSEAIASWPERSRLIAERMISAYGEPSVEEDRLVWEGVKPWKRVSVHRDGDAPLEQVAAHPVPEDKARELERVKGQVWAGLGKDEITARGQSEEENFLAVNLAHEVLTGVKTPEQARADYDREKRFASAGRASHYRQGLIFDEEGKTLEEKVETGGGMAPR